MTGIAHENSNFDKVVLENLLQNFSVAGKQVHDANIVATMQLHGIRHLLTNNGEDFARFSQLITVVPLEEISS